MANLFYIIGASGAGKDSLISYAKRNRAQDTPVIFAHRYITRQANAVGENHVSLTPDEFIFRKRQGCFAMDWYSHDTNYGIGIEIDYWLSKGLSVVINGSRSYLPMAAERYHQNLIPILIKVDHDILEQRLFARGRETASQITKRIEQAARLEHSTQPANIYTINNNYSLEEAGAKLCARIFNV